MSYLTEEIVSVARHYMRASEAEVDWLLTQPVYPSGSDDLIVQVIAALTQYRASAHQRHAGHGTSEAKAEASRRNGRKGGRPRKP